MLGRDDIGSLAPGMAADFIAVNLDRPAFAGAQADVVAALVLCQCDTVDYSFIHGRRVVDQGRLVTADLPASSSAPTGSPLTYSTAELAVVDDNALPFVVAAGRLPRSGAWIHRINPCASS